MLRGGLLGLLSPSSSCGVGVVGRPSRARSPAMAAQQLATEGASVDLEADIDSAAHDVFLLGYLVNQCMLDVVFEEHRCVAPVGTARARSAPPHRALRQAESMLEYVCSGQKRKLPEIIKSAAPEEPLSPPAFTPADMSKYAFDCSNCGQRVAHAASRERAALATPSPPGRPAAVRAAPRKVHGSRRPPGGAPGQRAPQVGRLRHGLAPSSPPRPARARPQRGVVRSTPPPGRRGGSTSARRLAARYPRRGSRFPPSEEETRATCRVDFARTTCWARTRSRSARKHVIHVADAGARRARR